jgi:hypothetical protein
MPGPRDQLPLWSKSRSAGCRAASRLSGRITPSRSATLEERPLSGERCARIAHTRPLKGRSFNQPTPQSSEHGHLRTEADRLSADQPACLPAAMDLCKQLRTAARACRCPRARSLLTDKTLPFRLSRSSLDALQRGTRERPRGERRPRRGTRAQVVEQTRRNAALVVVAS